MKLYAQGLARRLHEQRVGMNEQQMMQPFPGAAHTEPPEPPRVLQGATNRYNSGDVRERSGNGNCSKYDNSSRRGHAGASAPQREPRQLRNRIDASGEDVAPVNPRLAFEKRVAQKVKPLSIAEENAIDLIILGHSDRSVADHCGVHRVTVTRWRLYNPAFRAELSRRRQEIAGATADGFRQLAQDALVVMSKLLEDPNPSVRFRAARSVLAMTPRFAPPDEPIDVEGVLTAEARKLNVQFHETHPASAIVYEDERARALDHLMQRAGEDYTADEKADEVDDERAVATPSSSPGMQGEGSLSESRDSTDEMGNEFDVAESSMHPRPCPFPEDREREQRHSNPEGSS
jgi:hypothetical protein